MKLSFLLSALVSLTPAQASKGRELHENVVDLSNGAVLGVEIVAPDVFSTVELEGNATTTEITIKGNAHVGKGVPDVAYIYIIDSSGSTDEYDGDCGSTLECVQAFYEELHNETMANGSAELVAVIDFDDSARIVAGFQDPGNREVLDAIHGMSSYGGTACTHALETATLLVHQQKVASTTIVIFAGDGLCNEGDEFGVTVVSEDVTAAADLLGDTGAIVHSIAVGDNVNCSNDNDLVNIPRNGGDCFSIPEPKALPSIIDDLIGTELLSIEIEVDGKRYRGLGKSDTGGVGLPQDGAISVDFEAEVRELTLGTHEICIRATGQDSLGSVTEIVDCHTVEVRPAATPARDTPETETKPEVMTEWEMEDDSAWGKSQWTILIVVVASAGVLAVALHRIFRSNSGRAVDQAMAEEERTNPYPPMDVHQGVPIEAPQNVI